MSRHGKNARKQEWVFPLFSPDSDDRLNLNFHRFVILYISCDTRSVGLGQYCLPKVYNGFKRKSRKLLRIVTIKDTDTIGNCQWTVFSLGVSQHMHKITNLWKFELNWSSKLRDNNERKNTLSDAWFRDLKSQFWGLEIKFVENYFFLENYVTSEGAVSHNVTINLSPLLVTK